MRRPHLRFRVLLLTTAFALALVAITFGLSWRARTVQARWSRLVAIETEAIATAEEIVRAQNAFRSRFAPGDPTTLQRYRSVRQLLDRPALEALETGSLRVRVQAFETIAAATIAEWPAAGAASRQQLLEDLDAASLRVVSAAQSLAAARRRVIATQLPALERESQGMMSSGLAIAWIVVLVAFAVVQITLRNVVRPLEDLAAAAEKIAAGDVTARAPVGGDHEIVKLGIAFNRMTEELRSRARTDDLTGLPNFRAFRERIDLEIERASRYPEQFGILVLDLDRFKQYNDRFGHLAGNEALQRIAQVIRETVRNVDFPARYGGEEFAAIVPQIDVAALSTIAERVRAGVEALPAPANGSTITASIGAALFPVDGRTPDDLFHIADERLYEAKRLGRNRVVGPTRPKVVGA